MRNSGLVLRLGGALLAVALLATALVVLLRGPEHKRMTAYFTRTVGLYAGADVRILGIKVGRVTKVEPVGDSVRVDLEYEEKYKIPANAQAMVVNQTLVADRYIQLTPAYTGGPRIAAGARIDVNRTATPVELDQLYDSLKRLTGDLGPQGVNSRAPCRARSRSAPTTSPATARR